MINHRRKDRPALGHGVGVVVALGVLLVHLAPCPAAGVTEFYVDPDWQGAVTGAADTPWQRLTDAAWTTINDALTMDDVTVFFSARESDSAEDEATESQVGILRTDPSSHRLTLDGMSKYNANDAQPQWLPHSGTNRFRVQHKYPLTTRNTPIKRNNVTVRGFKAVSVHGQGLYYWGGDNVVIEHIELTQVSPTHGPGMFFGYARARGDWEDPCVPDSSHNGGCQNIMIRSNYIHDVFGEGLYVGGINEYGMPANTPLHRINERSHSNVVIEGNTVVNPGAWGGGR